MSKIHVRVYFQNGHGYVATDGHANHRVCAAISAVIQTCGMGLEHVAKEHPDEVHQLISVWPDMDDAEWTAETLAVAVNAIIGTAELGLRSLEKSSGAAGIPTLKCFLPTDSKSSATHRRTRSGSS